ncbi:MAG: hypothetical protein ACI956_002567 [Nonlabens sp.]
MAAQKVGTQIFLTIIFATITTLKSLLSKKR